MTDFAKTRDLFHLPEGMIYLDGNSLGPMPKSAAAAVNSFMETEWKTELIKGWNSKNWFMQTNSLGDQLGRIIGAPAGTTVLGDTLSIKVFQAVAAGLSMVSDRKIILSDNGNFPTDLYMVEGLMKLKSDGYELRTPAPEDVLGAIDCSVAVVMLTEVDYRTGRKHDMKAIIQKAHSVGAVVVWDLAHSAGAIPVDVLGYDTDFAVGCTYKYFNAGPGAPAFIYVAPRHLETVEPALSGWHGHTAPFAFDLGYHPASNIERMRIGTPPIAAFSILRAALDIWDDVDMADLHAESMRLSELFISEVEKRCPILELASPRDPYARGSQVSFRFAEGFACMQALISRGVIGDFRSPDIMRFGITPLYINGSDILKAAEILAGILANEIWKDPAFQHRGLVT